MDKYQIAVYNALRKLGIPAHVKGYEFLKSAMKIINKDTQSIFSMMKLYEAVAKEHDTTDKKVERGIRHAISLIRADDAGQYSVLGKTGHLANREFLSTLNESIKLMLATEESLAEAK